MTPSLPEALAGAIQVFPDRSGGQPVPNDRRLREIRHLNASYEPPRYGSLEEWLARADALRRNVLVSTGLWPLPERTSLNPVVFGRVERDGYSVEKVYFESRPGLFVAGNLYRPPRGGAPVPGVLSPHGHWHGGRLAHDERVSAPARCISFARLGCVAFSYDMVGYVDSTQVPHAAFGGARDALWGISVMALQLWNSIRALDFLASLPDVDAERLGCTGESGGATQTFMLTAVDDRIKVSAPVNMVSAHMQGGCLCENAPGLRLDADNVEIAALMAPRPMLLVSATGDWTKNTPTVEYPAIRKVYRLFGAEERLACVRFDAEHNYNLSSREAVYAFFGRWLLGSPEGADLRERPLTVEREADLRVFPVGPPAGALGGDELRRRLVDEAEAALAAHRADPDRFRAVYGPALRTALAAEWPAEVAGEVVGSSELAEVGIDRLVLGRPGRGDQVPALLFRPPSWRDGPATLVVHALGKGALVDAAGLGGIVRGLLAGGRAVLAIDAFLTGEYHTPAGRSGRDPSVRYFCTYNRTDTALRVQDVATALAYLQERAVGAEVDLVGAGEAGLWCLLARALAPAVPRTAADFARFDADDDASYLDRLYVPGLRRIGGVRTAIALAASAPLLIHNAGPFRDRTRAGALTVRRGAVADAALVDWLLASRRR